MKIGILTAGHVADQIKAEHGAYEHLFARFLDGRGFRFENWDVVDMAFPQGPQDADGWLVTGSKHGVYEDHAFIAPLEQLIRDIIAAGKPLIGVCFGHQIIAQALGGHVEKFAGGWAVGAHMYDFEAGGSHKLNAWHQDQVIRLPQGAQTVASNPFCAHAAVLYPGQAYTIQPHPEFENPVVEGLVAYRGRGIVPDDLLDIATEHLGDAIDNGSVADQFERFFKTKELS